jgi:hypothetical protein
MGMLLFPDYTVSHPAFLLRLISFCFSLILTPSFLGHLLQLYHTPNKNYKNI